MAAAEGLAPAAEGPVAASEGPVAASEGLAAFVEMSPFLAICGISADPFLEPTYVVNPSRP